MQYRIFKVVKVGKKKFYSNVFNYNFKNIGMAKCYASLEYSSYENRGKNEIVVKDENGDVVFNAGANSGGIPQSYAENASEKFAKIL